MCNRVLMIACVPSMIGQFNMKNIEILQELGYEVDVACDFTDRSYWNEDKVNEFKNTLMNHNISYYQIDFSRDMMSLKKHKSSYHQVEELCRKRNYHFVHCHTPIASAITRLVCKKLGIKVVYTAHGFHFYKGAPLKNWLIFYPIEKWLSKYTDVLITINKEDYERARKKFKMKQIEYVPGIGIDLDKFSINCFDRNRYRTSLGLHKDDVMLFSVGELNKNKNHKFVINILPSLDNNIHYFIAGAGPLECSLKEYACKLNIDNRVHLLGFRNDIVQLYLCSDVYIHPSIREGLPVALMEAIASKVLVLVSNIRGNIDLIKSDACIFSLSNDLDILQKLLSLFKANKSSIIEENSNNISNFELSIINNKMKKIYEGVS